MASRSSISLFVLVVVAATLFFPSAWGYDPEPLQDFCVADLSSKSGKVNGYPCKSSSSVTADDFVFHGLGTAASTISAIRAGVVFGVVEAFPAVNTLGLSIVRLDFAKGGIIPAHTHPRASELFHVLKGSIYAGFVTTDNKLFAKTLHEGDVMAFPKGLIHFQLNAGNSSALGIASLSSQSPGLQLVAPSLLGTGIPDEVLSKTLFIDKAAVEKLKAPFISK